MLSQLRRLPGTIKIRERLPIWALRALLGAVLLVFSELIMWLNPPSRSLLDWPVLLMLYVALAAVVMDLLVRFQARSIAPVLLVSGMYALLHAATINYGAFVEVPVSLVSRAMGLQTGAALYGLLFFVAVMRGKQPDAIQVLGALGIGVVWGIWVHWFPLQAAVNWGLVAIQDAQVYMITALVPLGVLVTFVMPRFQVVREKQFELLWWEAILVMLPLFAAMMIGIAQERVPFFPLLLLFAIGGFVLYALNYQKGGYDPSLLAELTFVAPNAITYIALTVIFLAAGTLSYGLITDSESIIGIIVYYVVLFAGAAWLPGASLLIFWRAFRTQTGEIDVSEIEGNGNGADHRPRR